MNVSHCASAMLPTSVAFPDPPLSSLSANSHLRFHAAGVYLYVFKSTGYTQAKITMSSFRVAFASRLPSPFRLLSPPHSPTSALVTDDDMSSPSRVDPTRERKHVTMIFPSDTLQLHPHPCNRLSSSHLFTVQWESIVSASESIVSASHIFFIRSFAEGPLAGSLFWSHS